MSCRRRRSQTAATVIGTPRSGVPTARRAARTSHSSPSCQRLWPEILFQP